jgi:hypothetical protein
MAEDTCTTCRAEVKPVITERGQLRNLDPTPTEAGNHMMITTDAGYVRARVLTGGTEQPAGDVDRYRVHRCPPPPPPGPACGCCGLPMHRELATALRWDTHPACDPEMQDQIALELQQARARQFRAGRRR